ncbi:hypothetical protein [Nonomuraea sp. NPDC050643]|uniref:hypothetical protein n=1 Tax=Nonomuraea sp. NPDC050643 TaxID=3155660 RepID=UPI00340155C7
MRLRTWLALGAAVTAGLLGAQPVVSAQAAAMVKYYADSGDSCRRGFTEGTLNWVEGPVIRPVVQVKGELSDESGITVCSPDQMHSQAAFVAYNGKTVVDRGIVKADNGVVPVAVALSDPNGVSAIDRVVVQVCRFSNSPVGISYCGKAVEYPRP